ncbi:MAG: NusG domain II-containing protein [Candidatus Cloacimonetes bacterium]|nr:NusG domain II-containing protein [Candidatus Cloacimonadota bacterium]
MVIIAVILSSISLSKSTKMTSVFIYKDNQLLSVYPINKNEIIRIDEHNTISISNGKVRMIAADCPDKRCVKQGYSSSMPIICMPNHLIIEIKAKEKTRKLILQ